MDDTNNHNSLTHGSNGIAHDNSLEEDEESSQGENSRPFSAAAATTAPTDLIAMRRNQDSSSNNRTDDKTTTAATTKMMMMTLSRSSSLSSSLTSVPLPSCSLTTAVNTEATLSWTGMLSSSSSSLPDPLTLVPHSSTDGNGNGNGNGRASTFLSPLSESSAASTVPLLHSPPSTDAPSSVIYDSARITDWRKVQSLALSHPHHASYKCTDGLTALHHVCSRRCPHPPVFQALIQAYPTALLVRDETKGWTPLHHACRFKCNREGVKLLLQSVPDYGRFAAKVRDKERGRTPLYYAIRYDAPDGVVELLLQCMNRMDILDCDRDGMSVLGLVWDRWVGSYEGKRQLAFYVKIVEQWKEKLRAAVARDDEEEENKMSSDSKSGKESEVGTVGVNRYQEEVWNQIIVDSKKLRQGLKGKLKACWETANMILRGAFQFPLHDPEWKDSDETGQEEEEQKDAHGQDWKVARQGQGEEVVDSCDHGTGQRRRTWRILHATVAIKCHPSLFLMATVLHPEQIRQLDCNDLFGSQEMDHVEGPKGRDAPSRQQAEDVLTALHLAAKSPTSGSESKVVLQHLLLFYPQAAKMINPRDSCLPLHYLCENESKQHWVNDGIRNVYEAFVDAAMKQDTFGRTPLHRAAGLHETHVYFVPPPPSFMGSPSRVHSQHSASSISNRSLASGEPLGSSSRYSASTVEAIGSSSRNSISSVDDPVGSIIQNIITAHPQVATIPDVNGKLLMHSIADSAENWDSNVQAIYDAYPAALSRRENTSKSLPLHLVASNVDAKPRLIQKLVEYHPRAASMMNGNGRLPLHLACESGKNWYGGMEDIFNAYPNAIHVAEEHERGWMPLHFLVSSPYSSVDTIEQVLAKGPDVAQVLDYLGRTPFHLAVETGKDWNEGGLEALFQAYPEAIDAPDGEGKIPLVTALMTFSRNDRVASSTVEHDANTTTSSSTLPWDNHHHGETITTHSSLQTVDECTAISKNVVNAGGDLQACSSFESDLSQINVLFHLLRAAPQVLPST